ncbi:MAG: hypothetical protein AAF840_03265 [Bacteroidota bacterium]
MKQEEHTLDRCLKQIEAKMGWGPAAEWTNQDFTTLSEDLAEKTGVHLSATTLKRIWGRVAYASKPSPTTLNALATYIGHDNWRSFRQSSNQDTTSAPVATSSPATARLPRRRARNPLRLYLYYLLPLAALALGISWLFPPSPAPAASPTPPLTADSLTQLNPTDFSFNFRPVTSGVPNSVVFNYDVEAAPPNVPIYLQQNWDERRRFRLPRDEQVHTSIYYLPGFFRAKLVVNDQIVKERDVYIRSEGWVAAAKRLPVPVYLPLDKVKQEGRLVVTPEILADLSVPLQPEPPEILFTHVGALDGLYTDDFAFSTRLRHEYSAGTAACQHIQILLLLKDGVISIPLSRPGCTADLHLFAGGQAVNGRTNDLSAFGVVSEDQWLALTCTGDGDLLTFSLNGQVVYTLESKEQPKEFVGIRYEFAGLGSVDEVAFANGGGLVWREGF